MKKIQKVFQVIACILKRVPALVSASFRGVGQRRKEKRFKEDERIAWAQLLYLAEQRRRDEINGLGDECEPPISWGDL